LGLYIGARNEIAQPPGASNLIWRLPHRKVRAARHNAKTVHLTHQNTILAPCPRK